MPAKIMKTYTTNIYDMEIKYQYIRKQKHPVFKNKENFERYFKCKNGEIPKLVEIWQMGYEGDWVVGNDGGVVQVLKRKDMRHPGNSKNYKYNYGYIRTIVGSFVIREDTIMDTDFKQHNSRYTFSKTYLPINKIEQIREEKEVSRKEVLFAMYVLMGYDIVVAYEKVFKSRKNTYKYALELIKQKRVRDVMTGHLKSKMAELKLDYDYILTELKDLIENSNRDDVKFNVLKYLAEITKLPEKVGQLVTDELSNDREMIEADDIEEIEGLERPKELKEEFIG